MVFTNTNAPHVRPRPRASCWPLALLGACCFLAKKLLLSCSSSPSPLCSSARAFRFLLFRTPRTRLKRRSVANGRIYLYGPLLPLRPCVPSQLAPFAICRLLLRSLFSPILAQSVCVWRVAAGGSGSIAIAPLAVVRHCRWSVILVVVGRGDLRRAASPDARGSRGWRPWHASSEVSKARVLERGCCLRRCFARITLIHSSTASSLSLRRPM